MSKRTAAGVRLDVTEVITRLNALTAEFNASADAFRSFALATAIRDLFAHEARSFDDGVLPMLRAAMMNNVRWRGRTG
jgi:hypothetical protein